ncbi:MAG: ribbon-helix-helix protein, CopG family [Gammaproteobacteria bacterium]|nr:ribbon-helix-helix protein, CopG family [Gammaproteobacteria bacterium]
MSTITLKISDQLKARIARLAKAGGRSAHSFMVEALEHEVERAERLRAFVREAVAADADIEAGGKTYRAEDVHAWLDRLADNPKAGRPKPCRK